MNTVSVLAHPRTAIFNFKARDVTFLALPIPCSTVQLILAFLNPSVAQVNTAISFNTVLNGDIQPLNIRHQKGKSQMRFADEPLNHRILKHITKISQLRDETTEVNSTGSSPVLSSRHINSNLVAVGIESRIFCRPSRGPTSTIRTDGTLCNVIAPMK